FSSGAGRTSDGNGSHASTLKSPSYTKSVSWQHYLNFSSKDLTNSYMNGMGKKEYSSYLGTPNNTYLKYNPKAKGNGVTIIRQGSN
ncbi:hypothetical protein, partial [Shigella boydii]|uniref:hypothetical protein n=4 Tax=Shigella TaxID=620 RepID=UPI003F495C3D